MTMKPRKLTLTWPILIKACQALNMPLVQALAHFEKDWEILFSDDTVILLALSKTTH